jgi:L-threonylcarbamoyladenylate synthase
VRRLAFATPAERAAAAPVVAAHLRSGGLAAYPTETVYGFGCALVETALARLALLKRRDPDKPFLLLVRSADALPGIRWTAAAQALKDRFWPGPLTLVVDAGNAALPSAVVGADGGVAIRCSPHAAVGALLDAVDGPITSTSANAPGRPPATDADAAAAALLALTDDDGLLLLDGGTLPPSASSTIVDVRGPRARVLRRGAIASAAIRAVLGDLDD